MLTCSIGNFRGIASALITVSPIALLAGANEQGKSSIIDALRNLLDGNKQPYGLTRAELPQLLMHQGADSGMVCIRAEGRMMQMDYPSGDLQTDGAPFRATPYATGSQRFSQLEPRARAQVLAEYLKARPTEDELVTALEASGAQTTEEHQKQLWGWIQQMGWDGAWERVKTDGTKAKGAWEHITKAKYGTKVGANWRPAGWTPEHEAIKDADVEAEFKTAEAALEQAIGKVAVGEDERKKLEALTKNIPKLKEVLQTRENDGKRAREARDSADRALRQVPVLPLDKWPTCPHCAKPVQVLSGRDGDVLKIPPKALSPEERAKIEEQAQIAERTLKTAQEAYDKVTAEYLTACADLEAATRAKRSLENSDPDAITPDRLQEMRDEVSRCRSIIAAKEKIRAALLAHAEVMRIIEVAKVLAPEGLRASKMRDRMQAFNHRLAELSQVAGWSAVTLDDDLRPRLAGVPYDLCSGSGRMRCDITIQMAFALQDGSEIVLIDETDILDGRGRNGLIALLQHCGLYAVIAMMVSNRKTVPDLAAAGIGQSFWVEGARAAALADVAQRAA